MFDFHALRHQFVSGLAKAGVNLKTAQELARHHDIKLTMGVYAHVSDQQKQAALEQGANFSIDQNEAQPENLVAAMVAVPEITECHNMDNCAPVAGPESQSPETTKPLVSQGFASSNQFVSPDVIKRPRRGSNPQPPDRQSGTLTN